jgi:uncharacterized protein (DUF2252 family)
MMATRRSKKTPAAKNQPAKPAAKKPAPLRPSVRAAVEHAAQSADDMAAQSLGLPAAAKGPATAKKPAAKKTTAAAKKTTTPAPQRRAAAPVAAASRTPLPVQKHLSLEERAATGKAQRTAVPLEALGAWEPGPERADPVAIITAQEADRLKPLLPVRHARMLQNAFGFYRGAPAVLAADLAATPSSGLEVQLCGDAHLLNFGVYGSPERSLVFDVNDFDETLPGPFEWDVKRLVASLVVAARGNGFSKKKARAIALASARSYRDFMRRFADMDTLTTWYTQMNADKIIAGIHDPVLKADAAKTAARATSRDTAQAAAKLTVVQDGKRTIVPQPPLVVPFRDLPEGVDIRDLNQSVRMNWNTYRHSLHSDVIKLLSRYRLEDLALKVVGVGSVGTRCFIGVFTGRDVDDVLFLQVKEADRSVLEPYLKRSRYKHQGERVVAGQRLTQSASDIFLGWSNGPQGGTFYWRQLRDWKGSVNVDAMDPAHLLGYGELCAWTLAKGHARSGDPAAIAAYLGKKDRFDVAMADFAEAYATQNEADYAAMKKAAEEGRIEVAEVF